MNRLVPLMTALCLLSACASQRDNFYTLNILPDGAASATATPTVHVLLQVDIPSLVDRAEMVVNTSDSDVLVLDHERWVSSLSDQVLQTLARDIEKRRSDVLVGPGLGQKDMLPVTLRVEIVRMSARRGRSVNLEAHWRIKEDGGGMDAAGSAQFDSPLNATGLASLASGYSQTLAALADRLADAIPARQPQPAR